MTKNAFVVIHFGNNIKYFEFELYFLKNLKLYTTQDIIYMYSVTDTPDIFVNEIGKIATHTIGYDDSSTTFNAVAPSHYTQFSTIRTCNFIYAYTLTQYDKICILESDLIITKNIDNIFLLKTPSVSYFFNDGIKKVFNPKMLLNNAAYKNPKWILNNCQTDSIINGGVIVVKPSINMFEKYTKNLKIVIERKCKYPNESLFSYTNPNFYNLPVKYNLLHYNLTPQRIKSMNLNLNDVCIVHFNETKYKYLDIIKEDWVKNMGDTEHNRNKRKFILDFKNKVYDVYKNEINNVLNQNPPTPVSNSTDDKAIYKIGVVQQENVDIGVFQMTVINTYERALNIAKKYIDNLQVSARFPYDNGNTTKLPDEIYNTKWNMSLPALTNTLKYLFEKLHHSCYMLCIMNNKYVIYKLEMTDAAPTFETAIKTLHLPMLQNNKWITPYQKEFITKELKDPVRILQCILKKQYGKDSGNKQVYNEYSEILYDLKLPNGVFILNLTDAVILKNDGMEPFPMVTGNVSLGNYNFKEYIPIMSMSGQVGYSDIPIPNYDDISIFDNKKTPDFSKFNTEWENKKIKKAVFRGGPSGCGYTPETNMRIKLALMKLKYVDVELSGKGRTIDSRSIKFDPVYGLGMLNTGIKPAKSFLTMAEQSNYKYIIHIDGNVNAYRLLTTMRTGSLILRVSSVYRSWVDHLIQPDIHYIQIKPDLSDLESSIEWCMVNDDKCRQIAKNGLDFAISVLQKEFIKSYFQKMLWSLSDYQPKFSPRSPNFAPPSTNSSISTEDRSLSSLGLSSNDRSLSSIPVVSDKSEEYIELIGKRCPKGYKGVTIRNKKMCKKHSQSVRIYPTQPQPRCQPGKEINPKSNRCVKICAPGYTRRASDFKCIKTSQQPQQPAKICEPGKELNPKTNRCVKICAPGYTRRASDFKCIKTSQQPQQPAKICEPGKELNPKTNRCVKICAPGYTRRASDFKCIKNTRMN